MIYRFKDTARIPAGVTADQILAELDTIADRFGKKSPDIAAKAVISDPQTYPGLRAFCPATAEEAFAEAVRRGVTYAVRCIIEVAEEDDTAGGRALYLVADDDGERVWEPITIIVTSATKQAQLIAELRRDAEVFTRKLHNVLAEIARLVQG
jgi:hypothetical protein